MGKGPAETTVPAPPLPLLHCSETTDGKQFDDVLELVAGGQPLTTTAAP